MSTGRPLVFDRTRMSEPVAAAWRHVTWRSTQVKFGPADTTALVPTGRLARSRDLEYRVAT
jgi:hypothetical protein